MHCDCEYEYEYGKKMYKTGQIFELCYSVINENTIHVESNNYQNTLLNTQTNKISIIYKCLKKLTVTNMFFFNV